MIPLGEDRRFREDSVPRCPLEDDHSAIRPMARQLDRALENQEQAGDEIAPMEQVAVLRQAAFAGAQGLQQFGSFDAT